MIEIEIIWLVILFGLLLVLRRLRAPLDISLHLIGRDGKVNHNIYIRVDPLLPRKDVEYNYNMATGEFEKIENDNKPNIKVKIPSLPEEKLKQITKEATEYRLKELILGEKVRQEAIRTGKIKY